MGRFQERCRQLGLALLELFPTQSLELTEVKLAQRVEGERAERMPGGDRLRRCNGSAGGA